MEKKNQRDYCRELIRKNEWKSAFKLAKGFDMIFSKEDIQKISISYECMVGNSAFYKMLGYDLDDIIEKSKNILLEYLKKYDSKK